MAVTRPSARVLGEGPAAAAIAAGLAWTGVRISCTPPDLDEVAGEPLLPELLRCLRDSGSLVHTEFEAPDAVLVCGAAVVEDAPPTGVVINCGLPPWESTRDLEARLGRSVVSNPQQLRDGWMLEDFLAPGCKVLGADDADALLRADVVLAGVPAPPLHCDVDSADLVLPATNGLCAVAHEFFEQLAELCSAVGADAERVAECVRADPRIGGVADRTHLDDVEPAAFGERLRASQAPPVLAELEARS